jgi:hypothetical protein
MLHVGVARTDITPPVGVELCGYGYYLRRASTDVLDPLMARAVHVASDEGQALFIGNDLIGVDAALTHRTRELCEKHLRLPGHCVMLAGTHTHSGPTTIACHGIGERDALYWDHLPFAWLELARQAKANARPATLRVGRGPVEPVGKDRNVPDGPTDLEARIARFDDAKGNPLAVLANHSAHAVVFAGDNTSVSADWPGWMERAVEEALPGAVAVFVQGACGTINPTPACVTPETGRVEIERIGRRFGDGVLALAEQATPCADAKAVRATRRTVALPARVLPPDDLVRLREEFRAKAGDESSEPFERNMARMRVGVCEKLLDDHVEGAPESYPAEIQVLQVGPLRVVGIPGELFMALGQRILDAQPDGLTMVAGYANNWIGYFPTREAYGDPRFAYPTDHAPYLSARFPFNPAAGEILTEAAIELL